MILADKISNLRKKNGWSQEELAHQLGVSRQAVSKWEGAQSVPELEKILMMSRLFEVSTDYLIKDEMGEEAFDGQLHGKANHQEAYLADEETIRKVTLEDANDYIHLKKQAAKKIAFGVFMVVLSPMFLMILLALSDSPYAFMNGNMATGIGMIILLLMVACGVMLLIGANMKTQKYEFLDRESIDTAYGVDGMVKEMKDAFHPRYVSFIMTGVLLCMVSIVPLFIGIAMNVSAWMTLLSVSLIFLIIGFATILFVFAGTIQSTYDKLLQEGEYTKRNKKRSRKTNGIFGVYWILITAIFLAYSFLTNDWGRSWIIWPVAGVLFAAFVLIVNAVVDRDY